VTLVFGLAFGVILLAGGDWIPGGIIVAATLIGLAVEIPVIAKLCAGPASGSYRRRQPPAPHA
jgi:hypothetical protein